jgi:endonuclease III-like uncharacterized protein
MSFPTAHVEECWQMAEFYNNKVLYLLDKFIITLVAHLTLHKRISWKCYQLQDFSTGAFE